MSKQLSSPTPMVKAIRAGYATAGIVSGIFAMFVLLSPSRTVSVLAFFIGIYFVCAGAFRLLSGLLNKTYPQQKISNIIFGTISLIAGIIGLTNIGAASDVLLIIVAFLIGIGLIVEGLSFLLTRTQAGSTLWATFLGISLLVPGITMLISPLWAGRLLLTVLGIVLLICAVVCILRAFLYQPVYESNV